MHLVECHFKDDAERRRIEYIIRKYKKDVEKSSGMMITVVNDEVLERFLMELRSKLIDEEVRVFKIEEMDMDIPPEKRTIRMQLGQKPHSVNAFLGYFVSKRGGELMKQLPGYHRWYRILSRKGKVELEVQVTAKDRTDLRISLEGFEPGLSLIADDLEKDLKHFKEGGMA